MLMLMDLGVLGIQLLQVSVPSVIQAGEGAALLCDVDLEGDILYSVKWYKDNDYGSEEFFRYVPRDSPQFLVYNVDGISINVSLYFRIESTFFYRSMIEIDNKNQVLFISI